MTYLYVLWAVEDDLVKIGISKNRQKRQETHSGNSSNPLQFEQWRLYRLDSRKDAVRLESEAKKELTRRGYRYRNKSELFRCSPVEAVRVIDLLAKRKSISVLTNFPFDAAHLLSIGLDFVDLPYYLLESLSPVERQLYLLGAANALHVLSYLDGDRFTAREISMLSSAPQQSEFWGTEMWRCMMDKFAIVVDEQRQSLIVDARRKIENEQSDAFKEWQEINEDAHDEAA